MHSIMRRWVVIVAGAGVAVTAVLSAARQGSSEPVSRASRDTAVVYRECPGDSHALSKGHETPTIYTMTGPSPIEKIKDIPEFHDCQKLLLDRGTTYGPLVAIFATYDLVSLDRKLMQADSNAAGKVAFAGAVLYNFGDRYAPLSIEPAFSCLYLWRVGPPPLRWRAKLVRAPDAETCGHPYSPGTGETGNLEVKRDADDKFSSLNDYPAVARWDWDDVVKQQYMGLQCGAAWCEIGPPGFKPSRPYLTTAMTGSDAERVERIKGWYDEQSLAEPRGPGGAFVPGPARATVIPAPTPDLGVMGTYHHKWAKVAYVALDHASPYYQTKLNLYATRKRAPLSRLNVLYFCHGTRKDCRVPAPHVGVPYAAKCADADPTAPAERWWVRIDRRPGRGSGVRMYRCVDRAGHETEGVTIPPTARWHWLTDDETVWKECVTGCCQVRVLGGG